MNLKGSSAKHLKVISANVAGIRAVFNKDAKKAAFKKLIDDEKPDVLMIQETKIQEKDVEKMTEQMEALLPGYQQYWTCSKKPMKLGYAGTACFVRPGSEEKVSYGLGDENTSDQIASCEGRVVTVELPLLWLVNSYVPNSGRKLDRLDYRTSKWDRQLEAYLLRLESTGKPVILVGDLNVCHGFRDIHNFYDRNEFDALCTSMTAREPFVAEQHVGKTKPLLKQPGCTPAERNSFSELLDKGFVDTFRHLHPSAMGCFTYWSQMAGNRPFNRGLRLDYVVASKSMVEGGGVSPSIADSYLLDDTACFPAFSDHCPIGCVVALE
jgi:exodeoxyribonuclease-3/AP endonuclease-1